MSAEFEAQRGRAFALAYRMLGSAADAEDIVQEAWIRWQRVDAPIEHPAAWMTKVVTRLCLDQLKSARVRRERYVGPWLPEPVVTPEDEIDPETISLAFLLLLERLTPAERAVYLLRQVFDFDYPDIAGALDRSEDAVRQLASRARKHVDAGRPRFAADPDAHLRLLGTFMMALQTGDVAAMESVLTGDVKVITDGGGETRAARRVVEGRSNATRLFFGLAKRSGAGLRPEMRSVNGWPSVLMWDGDRLQSMLSIETDGRQIASFHIVVNPSKLERLARESTPPA